MTDYPGKTTTYPQCLVSPSLVCYSGGKGGGVMKEDRVERLEDILFQWAVCKFSVDRKRT